MSRSFRHTPCTSNGGSTEKQDKRIYNRRLRTRVRQILRGDSTFERETLPIVREVSNPWSMSKDGKGFDSTLAAFDSTLSRVVRIRGGRRRLLRKLTEASVELAAEREIRILIRIGYSEDEALERASSRTLLEAHYYARQLRK